MSLQNRIRAIVCVALLLAAFVIFVPSGDKDPQPPENTTQSVSENAPEIKWHGASETETAQRTDDQIRPLFFGQKQSARNNAPQSNGLILQRPNTISSGDSHSLFAINHRESHDLDTLRNHSVNQQSAAPLSDTELVPIQFPGSLEMDDLDVDSVPHVISFGETLQSISTKYYGHPNDYLRIYEFNKSVLSDPIDLPSGIRIHIPR